jgi:hypothetical protein
VGWSDWKRTVSWGRRRLVAGNSRKMGSQVNDCKKKEEKNWRLGKKGDSPKMGWAEVVVLLIFFNILINFCKI